MIFFKNPSQQIFSQKKITIHLNGKTFSFFEEKMLAIGGRYEQISLYFLEGVNLENHQFAVKMIIFGGETKKFIRMRLMNCVLSETKVLSKFNHENIVKSHFSYNDEQHGNMLNFMEFCNSGSLEEYIRKKKQQNLILAESEIKRIFMDIRNYFKNKRKQKVFIHRNLKPNNILFHKTLDGKIITKIAGFSMAKIYPEGSNPRNSGDFYKDFQSPEMAEGKKISDQCDIWALGVILYYMCYFEYPWSKTLNFNQTFKKQKELFKGKNLEFEGKDRKISYKMKINKI